MTLNRSEAWKNIPAPQPEAEQAPATPPVPEQEAPLTPPIPPSGNPLFDNPFPAPGDLLRTPPALSSPPQTLKSIFDSPRYPSGQSPANLHIAPPSSHIAPPPSSRLEALHAMLLARHGDPELNAALGKNPTLRAQAALFDGSLPAKAAAAEQILRETMGEKKAAEPGLYFLALQEKLPQVATRQEALAAVYDHYTGIIEQNYLDNKTRRAAWQANRDTLEKTVPQVVSGLITPGQLNNTLTPEQLSIYNKEFDPIAINKASAAFSILQKTFSSTPEEGLRNMVKQRTAMQITSILSDDNGNGTYAINEKAFALFETSLMRLMTDVQEQSRDKYKFLHNLRLALFAPIHKRSEDMRLMDASRQSAEQQGNAALAGNIAELFGWQRGQENADALLNRKTEELASLQQEWQQSRAANQQEARVLGLLSTGQDLGNQSGDNASFSAKVVNCLGSVAGQTAPFFLPYAGWGLAFSEAFDDKRNRAYYAGLQPGTSEWSAFIDAATSTAVEKISFGAIGKFSRLGWAINKLPGTSKLRSTLMGNFWGRILTETGSGIAEETFLEPTTEAVLQWTARNNIAHWIGLKVGGNYDGEKYLQELSGMLQPEQFMATAIFVAGLSGIQTPSIKRAVREYSRSVEMLMLQGMDKAEAQRIAAIEDDEERQQAVNAAIKESGKNQKQRETNIAAGAAAFRSFAEVRATVESEAYKYYQQEMHLPHVEEKLDKPGFYTLTVLDKESGQKKFTQEMTEDQLVALFGQYFSADEKRKIHEAQSAFAANAFLRAAESTGELQSQDMLQWSGAESETAPDSPQPSAGQHPANSQIAPHPSSLIHQEVSSLGNMVRAIGSMNQQTFSYLTKLATQEFTRRTQAGMSEQEALSSPFAQLSPYVPLGTMMQLEQAFAARINIAEETTGEEDLSTTRLFKMRTSPGTTPADTLFMLTRGHVGSREMLEDLFEWRLDHITQGAPSRLKAIGSLLRDTQTSLQKLGFTGQFIAPQGDLTPLKIVEAMSKLALSDTLANADTLPLPQWQKDLLQYHVNNLADAHYLLNLGHAYNEGRQKGNITQDMADILRDLGHQVRTVFNQATIEQQDIQAVKDARALVNKLDPTNTPTASEIQEQQPQDAEAEKNHISTSDQSKKITPPTTEQNPSPSPHRTSDLPPSLQQVFPGGASYNPAAQTWLGMVPVDKLHLSPEVPQVKVNSGKKGVVNPLVGDYRSDAPPIYVWKRSNGRLEVVSGRHRLDLAQRTGTKTIAAYVYEEDATHDSQWARLLDYEQNMQDDQADELTAAIYVRETSLTDDELTRRGLTRSGTKSRRGLLIGREAREDLWTRFKSGAIKAQDAEAICQLTRYIQDKTRIDAMQLTAANDLANGKPLDFIAAKIQLMSHAAADGLTQSLISFGESFEADMERAAEYVSRCIGIINDHINAIKGVRTISKKGSVLETEGITAGLSADPAERLRELELLKAMYEKIGLYENLRIRALTWDEKTPPDPIGDHRLEMLAERARAEEEAAAVQEEEEDRKAAEALTPGLGFSLTPSRSPKSTFPALWKQAAKELNILGSTSFALNGSRVAIHTISEDKFRQALELGGMPNPAVQIADIQSGPVHYAEIGAILHPDLIDPAKTPGARIWQGDTWTRMMPEKITEEGDSWDNEEHTEEDIPWFYDAYGDLVEWNRDNLDQHMKAKHLGSFLPHDIPTDEVLDNYGEEGGAFPLILASQAYAVEFDSIRQAAENDNNTLQIDRLAAEQASNELQKQFHNLLSAYYLEPRSLQKFLMEYWREDATPETVAQALINEYLIDDPSDIYDEDTEEYADLKQSNESIAEEIADFITACRSSAKPYYEAAHGGWLSPSDFTGFIIPSHLEETLRPQLEQRGLPVYTYDLTEEDAALLNNPWRVAKTPWIKDVIDERRNDALRDFLEDHDVSFSLTPGDNPQESNIVPRPSYMQLGLRPTALAAAWHKVEQSAPVTIPISPDTKSDQQGYSKLARKSFISLRSKTRQQDTLPRQSIRRREELDKPFLRTADNRTIYLGEKDWSRFITSSPHAPTLTAMGALEPLIATARYLHTAPEFNPGPANQIKARHYYLGKVNDPIHGTSLVLLTLREDTRGTYLETLQTEETSSLGKKNRSASSQTDFGLTHRAAGRSLPAPTLHTIKQFVNFIDEQSQATNAFLAPNGQPTKLTPDQWLLTRTQPFLNYFGDWLHDPSSASAVLDPNGEPLVCHRGLKQHYNPGIRRNYTWVSSSRELSEEYASGGTVLDLFISARRPFRFPDGLTRQTSDQFRETLKTQLASEAELGNITSDQNQTAATTLDTLIHGDKETEAFKIWEHFKELKDILSDLGYDAVSTEENGIMTYGLFQPGQAKSSTTNYGTYDIARPDITFALTPEEKRIVQQAQTEGSWLAAPNGQTTRLTEKQWIQVRTKAFREWFGDWLHDPAHSSRVMDGNGEPLVVYHGTRKAGFTVFDNRAGAPSSHTPAGSAFFAASPPVASSYAGTQQDVDVHSSSPSPGIYPCFLNMRSPLEEDFEGDWWDNRGEPWYDLYDKTTQKDIPPPSGEEYWKSEQEARDYASTHGITDYMLIRTSGSRTTDSVVQDAMELGRDGAIIRNVIDPGEYSDNEETDVYVALRPEQIKSATQNRGSFDPLDPDITFSVIGPHAKTWDNYKDNAFAGRDDGKLRAEIDASQATLKDYTLPYREHLQQTLAILRKSLPKETRVDIKRYLSLHRKFYINKRKATPEKHPNEWREYLSFEPKKESWEKILSEAFLQTRLCHGDRHFAESLAYASLNLLLKNDDYRIKYLSQRGLMETALPLEEHLDYPELFAAYPQLRTLPVLIDNLDGYNGLYSRTERTIYLNRHLEALIDTRSILLHEVQHAIQHMEGFARGGTSESAQRAYEQNLQEMKEKYARGSQFMDWINARHNFISTLEYMHSMIRNPRRILKTSFLYSYDKQQRLTGEERTLDMARYAIETLIHNLHNYRAVQWDDEPRFVLPLPDDYNLQTISGIKQCLTAVKKTASRRMAYRSWEKPRLAKLHTSLTRLEKLQYLTPIEYYQRLAGEIEARNVQYRRDWINRERTQTPFNDTLEYSGESITSFSLFKRDHEYKQAVESGDMVKAQAMVNAQAAQKQYTGNEDFRMDHHAPANPGGSTVKEHDKAGSINLRDLAGESRMLPSDYFDHADWYNDGSPSSLDSFYKIRRIVEKLRTGASASGIRIYRAIPKNVKEDTPRNGDWVTPSRLYAEEHGMTNIGTGQYRIQIKFASLDSLWWNGDDINEWGYDDGKNYAYRNTKNNRKLLDPVTYDWEGQLVPLSKRFNYRHWDTAFSLSSLKQIVSSLSAPSLQATRAAELIKDFDNAAENWRRVMSAKTDKPNARVGAELFGMINSLLSSARYVLPPGYRSRVHLQMQWASVYAAMAETGEIPPKGTLQSGDIFYQRFEESVVNDTTAASTSQEVRQIIVALGSQRLDRTMSKILDRVRDQLVYFAKDQLYEKTMRRVEAVYPQKEPGKKSPRGRMEADAYRSLAQYRQMLVTSTEGKAEALAALGALYKEEQDEDKIQQYERDLLAWKTYGDYKGMSLPQAQNAMEKLLEYLLTNRNAWERNLETDRSRTKYTARRIARNLPEKNSGTSRARSRIDNRTRLRKCLIALPYSFMSYSHLMLALEPILGQRFSRARIQDITDANAALLNDSNDRAAWLSATIRHIAGLKTESQAEQWLVHFDTPQQTGITLNPEITITTKLTLEEAQDWIALTPAERTTRRLEIKQGDERTETLTENVPQEEDIPLLQEALSDYLSRTDAQQNRQQVLSVERTAINAEAAGPLTCSRDCALYAILLHEQKDYADQYNEVGELIRKGFLRREGFDDDGIAALYEFVGSEGLEYGYALRKKLGEKGQTLAQVYEQRMGVPFTLKENYFRATFDRNSTREKDTLAEPQNSSIGSGKYGLLIDRILHAENLDYSKSATLVFLAASAEQDNYIYTSHITADWRALLRNKQLEQKLRQHLGEDIMGKLSAWMDLIDGASLENNRAFLHLSRMQGMLQRAFAISVLAGNGYVLLKQSTAILHGFFAGWIPSEILERADGSQELAHRHISFSNYLFHLAASQMGLGNIPLKTIAATPYFTARMRGEGHILAQIGNQMPGQQYSRLEKIPETAMNLIETVDVKANLHAMHALANAYYAKAKELNEKNDSPFTDAQLRQAAINQVGQSLELGAQPLTKTQKSMSQAAGGILSKLAFVMKSEQLNKIGLMAAQWKTGSTRNRVCAAQSWLALGITSSLLAWLINWIKGMDDEDDEKKWKKYAATALLGDLTTIPLAGEAVNSLTSLVTGERVFADSYARTLIDVGGITRAGNKEYAHLAGDKELDWDAHFNNLTALARFSGVGGIFSRSPSAILSSYGALSLSAATGANISRTSKDLLTTLFRDEKEEKKRRRKNRNAVSSHPPTA